MTTPDAGNNHNNNLEGEGIDVEGNGNDPEEPKISPEFIATLAEADDLDILAEGVGDLANIDQDQVGDEPAEQEAGTSLDEPVAGTTKPGQESLDSGDGTSELPQDNPYIEKYLESALSGRETLAETLSKLKEAEASFRSQLEDEINGPLQRQKITQQLEATRFVLEYMQKTSEPEAGTSPNEPKAESGEPVAGTSPDESKAETDEPVENESSGTENPFIAQWLGIVSRKGGGELDKMEVRLRRKIKNGRGDIASMKLELKAIRKVREILKEKSSQEAGTSPDKPVAGTSPAEPEAGTSPDKPVAGTSPAEPEAGTGQGKPVERPTPSRRTAQRRMDTYFASKIEARTAASKLMKDIREGKITYEEAEKYANGITNADEKAVFLDMLSPLEQASKFEDEIQSLGSVEEVLNAVEGLIDSDSRLTVAEATAIRAAVEVKRGAIRLNDTLLKRETTLRNAESSLAKAELSAEQRKRAMLALKTYGPAVLVGVLGFAGGWAVGGLGVATASGLFGLSAVGAYRWHTNDWNVRDKRIQLERKRISKEDAERNLKFQNRLAEAQMRQAEGIQGIAESVVQMLALKLPKPEGMSQKEYLDVIRQQIASANTSDLIKAVNSIDFAVSTPKKQ